MDRDERDDYLSMARRRGDYGHYRQWLHLIDDTARALAARDKGFVRIAEMAMRALGGSSFDATVYHPAKDYREAPAAAAATKAPQAEVTPAEVLARIVSFERRERYRSTVLNKMLVILLELARDRLGDQRMTEERRKFLSDLIHENIIWAERVSDGDGERMPGGFSDDTMTIVFGRTDGHPLDGWQDF